MYAENLRRVSLLERLDRDETRFWEIVEAEVVLSTVKQQDYRYVDFEAVARTFYKGEFTDLPFVFEAVYKRSVKTGGAQEVISMRDRRSSLQYRAEMERLRVRTHNAQTCIHITTYAYPFTHCYHHYPTA